MYLSWTFMDTMDGIEIIGWYKSLEAAQQAIRDRTADAKPSRSR
jgi:hypothetical protein